MSLYVVSTKQIVTAVLTITTFILTCVWFASALINYLDLPEVYLDSENKCVKVVNFKNGDGYVCQDVNVTLRKYVTVHVQQQQ